MNNAAMDNGTMDNATMGQWGNEIMDNGNMDAGAMDTRAIGPWDSENLTVGHWRIEYGALGRWDSGATGRGCHGRRDNAQQDNAMDHLRSMNELQSSNGLVVEHIVAIDVARARFPADALSRRPIYDQGLHVLPGRQSRHETNNSHNNESFWKHLAPYGSLLLLDNAWQHVVILHE
jgi:hypothetical protein